MNVRNLIMAYVLIGAMMWAGGVVPYQADQGVGAGIATEFVDAGDSGNVSVDEQREDDLQQDSGAISEVVDSVVGAIGAFFKLLSVFINFLFYPVSVLVAVDAPQRVTVLLGVAPTVAFYVAVIAGVRG